MKAGRIYEVTFNTVALELCSVICCRHNRRAFNQLPEGLAGLRCTAMGAATNEEGCRGRAGQEPHQLSDGACALRSPPPFKRRSHSSSENVEIPQRAQLR